jgi:hypothetical protein
MSVSDKHDIGFAPRQVGSGFHRLNETPLLAVGSPDRAASPRVSASAILTP